MPISALSSRTFACRASGAVEPHFSEIQDECYAGFDRLGADVLIPIIRQDRAIGGLAIGPRAAGDLYERPELDALTTVAQQAVQSIIAVGSGGVTGRGFTQGVQKLYYLPEAHTDFIYAVISEEFGLIGATAVLAFGTLAYAAKVKSQADDKYDFSKLKTFSAKIETGWNNPISEQRVLEQVVQALEARGLRQAPEGEADAPA